MEVPGLAPWSHNRGILVMQVPGLVHGLTLIVFSNSGSWSSAWTHTRGILVMQVSVLEHGPTLGVFKGWKYLV